jgi:hypothetical protein
MAAVTLGLLGRAKVDMLAVDVAMFEKTSWRGVTLWWYYSCG